MDTEILIVGAGPCGLMAANELGRRGVRVLVADREAGVATAPQANATQARTMEHFRRLGFAAEVRKLGLPGDYPTDVAYVTTMSGTELGRFRMPPSAQADAYVRENAHIWNAAEMPHRIPQSLIESTLLDQARSCETVQVDFNWNVTGFEEGPDGVTTTMEHVETGETRSVRSAYLFAADGPRSTIRKQLGIRYGGADSTNRDFFGGDMLSVYIDAPEFYDRLKFDKAWMYWTFNRRRRSVIAATDGVRSFSFATQLRPAERDLPLDEAFIRGLMQQALGDIGTFTITETASWTAGRALVSDKMRSGRVLLGGDAAHLFTPTGGMGYNTAIEDAVNAGWKLAAVLRGEAPEALLDSYEPERRAVALRNTSFAARFADAMGLFAPPPAIEEPGPAGDFARKRAGAYLVAHARNEFTIPGFSLGARYNESPVIWPEQSLNPPDMASVYAPSAKPGGRAPHLWLADGRSLFDTFGFNWTLMCLTKVGATAAAFEAEAQAQGVDLKVLDLTSEPIAADLYQCAYALVRPDQVVAWRGDAADSTKAAEILDFVRGAAA